MKYPAKLVCLAVAVMAIALYVDETQQNRVYGDLSSSQRREVTGLQAKMQSLKPGDWIVTDIDRFQVVALEREGVIRTKGDREGERFFNVRDLRLAVENWRVVKSLGRAE